MQRDEDFFSALQREYLRVRSRLARRFSMWRYDHCEFFKVNAAIKVCPPPIELKSLT
jgi:hypothetical protein